MHRIRLPCVGRGVQLPTVCTLRQAGRMPGRRLAGGDCGHPGPYGPLTLPLLPSPGACGLMKSSSPRTARCTHWSVEGHRPSTSSYSAQVHPRPQPRVQPLLCWISHIAGGVGPGILGTWWVQVHSLKVSHTLCLQIQLLSLAPTVCEQWTIGVGQAPSLTLYHTWRSLFPESHQLQADQSGAKMGLLTTDWSANCWLHLFLPTPCF